MPDSIWFVKIAVAIRHNTFSPASNSAHNRNNKFLIVANHLLTSWSGTSWNNLWSIHRKCFAGKSGSVTKPLVTIPIRHKIRLRAPLMPGKWRVSAMAPKKRKSGEGAGGGPKAKAKKGGELPLPPPDSILMPHMRLFNEWGTFGLKLPDLAPSSSIIFPKSIWKHAISSIVWKKTHFFGLAPRTKTILDAGITLDQYLTTQLADKVGPWNG